MTDDAEEVNDQQVEDLMTRLTKAISKPKPGEGLRSYTKRMKEAEDGGFPVTKRGQKRRDQALQAIEMRKQGHSWRDISRELGFTSSSAALKLVRKVQGYEERETSEELRDVQNARLEDMYKGLEPQISQGRTRAVEVGVKVLERQARLQGIDHDAVTQGSSKQTLIINVLPHPDDPAAVEFVRKLAANPGEIGSGGTGGTNLLPPPIEGVLLDEEDNSSGGGDRRR